MNPLWLYGGVGVLLLASAVADAGKTRTALRKTWKAFVRLLPDMAFILLLVGLSLAVIPPDTISRLLGESSGLLGASLALLIGSASLLPSFIAFPLGATLLENGAGLMQTGIFISALMGVGVLTFPLERKSFGVRFAVSRNLAVAVSSVCFGLLLLLVTRRG